MVKDALRQTMRCALWGGRPTQTLHDRQTTAVEIDIVGGGTPMINGGRVVGTTTSVTK